MTHPPQLGSLLQKEAAHWSSVHADPGNPQIWHDDRLFEIFFGREYATFVGRICQHGPKILELGCGEGALTLTLARCGFSVTALDLSEARLSRGREAAQAIGLSQNIEFRMADLNTVELPPNTYSCVVAHDSLHHIFSLDHLLAEVSKTLIAQGAFLVMDYIGMTRFRKLLAAALFAVLPTYQPYSEKWRLRKRLSGFLSSEEEKRNALAGSDPSLLHTDSPFEEISQSSIVDLIQKRFSVQQSLSFLPFWFYLAPKIRIPKFMKYGMARLFKTMDNGLRSLGIPGAYILLDARKLYDAPTAH